MLTACGAITNEETPTTTTPQDLERGILYLYTSLAGDSKSCQIPIINGKHNFNSHNCDNDQYSYFKLEYAPSATLISFDDNPNCSRTENFYAEIKVSKNLATMETPVPLELLLSTAEGQVAPGTFSRVMKRYRKPDSDIQGKLSCVEIIRSAVPTTLDKNSPAPL
jgi:hypothetical protein